MIDLKTASRQLYILKRDLSVLGRSKRCYLRSRLRLIQDDSKDESRRFSTVLEESNIKNNFLLTVVQRIFICYLTIKNFHISH